jgi:hypothetical protein
VRRHLHEERLLDCYLAERDGTPLDPPMAEHLADCDACSVRYADLSRFMDGLRAEADAETDAIFSADRLRIQQQQIARRIAHVGRAARVISFPGQLVRRTMTGSATSTPPRWVAAAVAAGLFIGVGIGASYQWNGRSRHTLAAESARMTPVATRGTGQADVASDDAFLSELEIALERPHTRELQAFDTFTPHVREIRDQR